MKYINKCIRIEGVRENLNVYVYVYEYVQFHGFLVVDVKGDPQVDFWQGRNSKTVAVGW